LFVFPLVSEGKDVYDLLHLNIFYQGDEMDMRVVVRGIGMMVLVVVWAGIPALADQAGTAAPPGQKAIRPPVGAPVSDKLSTMRNAAIKGVAMLQFEPVRIKQTAADCRCEYEITIRNTGASRFKGDIGVNTVFSSMGENITGGTNALHLDLVAGSSVTETRPFTIGCEPRFKQVQITLRQSGTIINTQTIDLTQAYSGKLLEVSVASGKITATVQNTSGVATTFFVQFHKPNPDTPGAWLPAGGIAFDCIAAGDSMTRSVNVPAGWPADQGSIKVLLKIGPATVQERMLGAGAR